MYQYIKNCRVCIKVCFTIYCWRARSS